MIYNNNFPLHSIIITSNFGETSPIFTSQHFNRIINCYAIPQKVHKVGKQNFTTEAFKENEVKMIKIVFLQTIIGRDIQQHHAEVLEGNNVWQWLWDTVITWKRYTKSRSDLWHEFSFSAAHKAACYQLGLFGSYVQPLQLYTGMGRMYTHMNNPLNQFITAQKVDFLIISSLFSFLYLSNSIGTVHKRVAISRRNACANK